MYKASQISLSLACVAALCLPALAMAKRPPRAIEPSVWESPSFQHAHPDLRYRISGQAHFEDRRFTRALADFAEAAQWGDKLSQAMLGEMYWDGIGVELDRATAYAWMDLAAERNFVPFVAKRERYWVALTAEQRERALVVGRKLYETCGDKVAQPRLSHRLRKEAREMTGSRVAMPGAGRVILPRKGGATVFLANTRAGVPIGLGGNQMSFEVFYAKEFWRDEPYAQWQQEQIEFVQRGIVRVGSDDGSTPPDGQL